LHEIEKDESGSRAKNVFGRRRRRWRRSSKSMKLIKHIL
jgi:hypothetical protein